MAGSPDSPLGRFASPGPAPTRCSQTAPDIMRLPPSAQEHTSSPRNRRPDGIRHCLPRPGRTLLSAVFGQVLGHWNMISVPLNPADGDLRKSKLFPTSKSNAFAYEGGY